MVDQNSNWQPLQVCRFLAMTKAPVRGGINKATARNQLRIVGWSCNIQPASA